MTTERKLLMRAAMFTTLLALAGVSLLYVVQEMTGKSSNADMVGETVVSEEDVSREVQITRDDISMELPETVNSISPSPVTPEPGIIFIHEVFPLVSGWQSEALRPHVSEQSLASLDSGDWQAVMNTLGNRLGELENYETPQRIYEGRILADTDIPSAEEYGFTAWYEYGEADVRLSLAGLDSSPSLLAFHFDVQ